MFWSSERVFHVEPSENSIAYTRGDVQRAEPRQLGFHVLRFRHLALLLTNRSVPCEQNCSPGAHAALGRLQTLTYSVFGPAHRLRSTK